MKLVELQRHLRRCSCVPYREGGSHSVWLNVRNNKIAGVPRHREIKEGTLRAICKQLEIPMP